LLRAWLLLGGISAVLVMSGYLFTLWRAGWHPGDPTGPGTALHHAYRQAIAPFPFVVWGADELARWTSRRRPQTQP
jgi:hypothetical protein